MSYGFTTFSETSYSESTTAIPVDVTAGAGSLTLSGKSVNFISTLNVTPGVGSLTLTAKHQLLQQQLT